MGRKKFFFWDPTSTVGFLTRDPTSTVGFLTRNQTSTSFFTRDPNGKQLESGTQLICAVYNVHFL